MVEAGDEDALARIPFIASREDVKNDGKEYSVPEYNNRLS
jgi:hypothetical protein